MCKLEVFGCILLSLLFAAGNAPDEKCEISWEKVGCFRDDYTGPYGRVYPYELVNHRDVKSNSWDGHILDWNKWPESLHALACKCSEETRKLKYDFFGLQFYGECWSGPSVKFYRDGMSTQCIGTDYKPCNLSAKTECVGKVFTNYVYRLKAVQSDEKIDGGWSDWASWTTCSASCNGGTRIRERKCDNPEPKNGGKECQGDESTERPCNVESCQPMCNEPLEIGIILDASTSVTRRNWKETLEFVKRFSKEFRISPKRVHFGVIKFAWFPTMQFSVSDKTYWQREAFERKISNIRYTYGGTRTDLAIKLAEKRMLCPHCDVRPHVKQSLVVVTDGKSSKFSSPMSTATKKLKKDGVHIIAVGVGKSVDKKELLDIATDETHVFMLNGYKYLDDAVNRLVKFACVKECWTKITKGCVRGHNIVKYADVSVKWCKEKCFNNTECVAFEYGVSHDGSYSTYKPRDCQLQDSSDASGCPGAKYNLDLYVLSKTCSRGCWTKITNGCVRGHNIVKYADVSVKSCKEKCLKNKKCVAFEYGVSHDGSSSTYKPRDCQLQDSSDATGCPGAKYNLDLYVFDETCPREPVEPVEPVEPPQVSEPYKPPEVYQ